MFEGRNGEEAMLDDRRKLNMQPHHAFLYLSTQGTMLLGWSYLRSKSPTSGFVNAVKTRSWAPANLTR